MNPEYSFMDEEDDAEDESDNESGDGVIMENYDDEDFSDLGEDEMEDLEDEVFDLDF